MPISKKPTRELDREADLVALSPSPVFLLVRQEEVTGLPHTFTCCIGLADERKAFKGELGRIREADPP